MAHAKSSASHLLSEEYIRRHDYMPRDSIEVLKDLARRNGSVFAVKDEREMVVFLINSSLDEKPYNYALFEISGKERFFYRHKNPQPSPEHMGSRFGTGGWVEGTAMVSLNCQIDFNSIVMGKSLVESNSHIPRGLVINEGSIHGAKIRTAETLLRK